MRPSARWENLNFVYKIFAADQDMGCQTIPHYLKSSNLFCCILVSNPKTKIAVLEAACGSTTVVVQIRHKAVFVQGNRRIPQFSLLGNI